MAQHQNSGDGLDRIRAQWAREAPGIDTTAMGLLGRIYRLADGSRAVTGRTFARFGLTGPDFDVLATLRRSGAPYRLTPGALSSALMVSSGGMSARLDRLEGRDLLRRETSSADLRSRYVTLTPAGADVVDRTLLAHVATQARLVEPLDHDEQEQLSALLRRLLRHVDEVAAADPAPTSIANPSQDVQGSMSSSAGD